MSGPVQDAMSSALAITLEKFDRMSALQQVVITDVAELMDRLEKEPANQTLRMAFVRGAWGYKEGCLNGLDDLTRAIEGLANEPHPNRATEETRTKGRIQKTFRRCGDTLVPGRISRRTIGRRCWRALGVATA